jgi:hypothetical protein
MAHNGVEKLCGVVLVAPPNGEIGQGPIHLSPRFRPQGQIPTPLSPRCSLFLTHPSLERRGKHPVIITIGDLIKRYPISYRVNTAPQKTRVSGDFG